MSLISLSMVNFNLLLVLFYQSTPSWLKDLGWWWVGVVANVILVSAQVLLVLTFDFVLDRA